MPLFNLFETKLGREFNLTFFCKKQTKELTNALLPLGFRVNKDGSISWISQYKTVFSILPFKHQNPDLAGYILHCEGDYKTLLQLINHTLVQFSPEFVNVEMRLNEGLSQNDNIRVAQQKGFKAESMLGIYTSNNIGIILLPDGTTVLQVRTKNIPINKLDIVVSSIEQLATYFKKEEAYDLFTINGGILA